MMTQVELSETKDPLDQTVVQLTLDISSEALHRVEADFNPTKSLAVGKLLLLFAAVMTRMEELHDEQHRGSVSTADSDVNALLPATRRYKDLKEAGRLAAMAISKLEEAALLGIKAQRKIEK
jgi:hypothetical protein